AGFGLHHRAANAAEIGGIGMAGQRRTHKTGIGGIQRLDPPIHRAASLHRIHQMRGLGAAKGFDQSPLGTAMTAMDGKHGLVLDHATSPVSDQADRFNSVTRNGASLSISSGFWR